MSRALVCGLSLLALAVVIPASSLGRGGERVLFPQAQSTSDLAFRPPTLDVAGDGSFVVKRMRWGAWNRHAARGKGVGLQGFYRGPHFRGPVRVLLYRPDVICGARVFSKATFIFTKGRPDGIPHRWHWDLGQFPCGV